MGALVISEYPILVELIHNDVIDHTIEDEWGVVNVYIIRTIHFINRTAETWNVQATDERGHTWTGTINPQQEGTINIPTARRFDSAPLSFGLTFVRA